MPPPTSAQEMSVLRSIVYASLFDYPLTRAQLRETLVGVEATDEALASWLEKSPLLAAAIDERDGLYFPRDRTDLLETRRRRERCSLDLLEKHGHVLALLARMPFVRMVAISGSVAHLNAERDADLDLFVVTSAGRVWSVMTTVLLLTRLLGWRKHVCLNYVLSERMLEVQPPDLFSANQVIHLKPLWGAATYHRFLDTNRFVRETYPNFRPKQPEASSFAASADDSRWRRPLEAALNVTLAPIYERACRFAYGWYLRRQSDRWRSREHVRLEPECLKLHTASHRDEVMAAFEKAMAETLREAGTLLAG
jgi:hypothetical protein